MRPGPYDDDTDGPQGPLHRDEHRRETIDERHARERLERAHERLEHRAQLQTERPIKSAGELPENDEHPVLQHFGAERHDHHTGELQHIIGRFRVLAEVLNRELTGNTEKQEALRDLLKAKESVERAYRHKS